MNRDLSVLNRKFFLGKIIHGNKSVCLLYSYLLRFEMGRKMKLLGK